MKYEIRKVILDNQGRLIREEIKGRLSNPKDAWKMAYAYGYRVVALTN